MNFTGKKSFSSKYNFMTKLLNSEMNSFFLSNEHAILHANSTLVLFSLLNFYYMYHSAESEQFHFSIH